MSKIQYGYWVITIALLGGLLMPQGVWADPKDKSGYTLLTATPANLMRDMSTDRPDQTESPYTVDAGAISKLKWMFSMGVGTVTVRMTVIGLSNRLSWGTLI